MDNLKPCPFCGGEAEYTKVGNTHIGYKEATVRCTSCYVKRTQRFIRKKFDFDWIDKTMIESWNRRAYEQEIDK